VRLTGTWVALLFIILALIFLLLVKIVLPKIFVPQTSKHAVDGRFEFL
jgi:hypothetical protein